MGKNNCSDNEMYEQTLSEEMIFEGKVFTCVTRNVKLTDGSESIREVVIHTGGACILPVDSDLNCYLVRQYRSGAGEIMLEVPAGKIEPGEEPVKCAIRELKEETGFVADKVESLGVNVATPAYCSERIHMFMATGLEYAGAEPEVHEFLGLQKIPLTTLVEMCDKGEIKDSKTVISIYKASRRLL
ncbi:ADP-ribose pyrophosphatase [Ruminococcaceae bacterium YRB3002]|nr:ADP-ribose pyrophosphatase [Ruminococcaceae bacterium YRB3002]